METSYTASSASPAVQLPTAMNMLCTDYNAKG